MDVQKRARAVLYQPRSTRDPLLEAFGFFKKNIDFFDPNSDDYLYTLFMCEQLFRSIDAKAKRLDINPAAVCANNTIIYKMARRVAALRQAKDTAITWEKLTDTLSQENEEEGQFLASMDENECKKLV